MDQEPSWESPPAERQLSRRALVRSGVGITTATLTLGFAGTSNAQILTNAALPASAPTLSRSGYIGLVVQVVAAKPDTDVSGVETCEFVASGGDVVAYEIRLIDKIQEDHRTAESTLYAAADNEDVHPGKVFIINGQNRCSDQFVSVELEQIGASEIPSGANVDVGEIPTPGVPKSPTATTTTDTAIPGFSAVTAIAGIGAAVTALRRRAQ